jgi:Domain of unknown function (DUF4352)
MPGQLVTDGVAMKTQKATPALDFALSNDARAQAPAERAHHHAVRPWFKKKRFMLPLALIVVMALLQAANSGPDETADTAKNDSPPTAASVLAPGIGTVVHDGNFEFVVTGVERPGKTLAGKAGETLTAQGEFVVIQVDITNIGNETRTPDCSCQVLSNDQGQKFQPSPAILNTKEALKFVTLINPGDTVKGVLMLFDMTPGTNAMKIELHYSRFSEGVTVTL